MNYKKNYRIRKTKDGNYVYRKFYVDDAWKRYKKDIKEKIAKGYLVEIPLNKKEFEHQLNLKLDKKITGQSDERAYDQMLKDHTILKKRSYEKFKKLAKQYNVNANVKDSYDLHDRIVDLVNLGAFGNQEVDEFLY